MTFVTTDYRQTENQDLTWNSFLTICKGIRCGYIDVLIIHSANDMEEALSIAEWLLPLCKEFGVKGYLAHNDLCYQNLISNHNDRLVEDISIQYKYYNINIEKFSLF